jgi:hypothetical protein
MSLPKALTTVTVLSKTLALILFITLPFIGFYIGRQYQKAVDQYIYTKPHDQIYLPSIEEPLPKKSWKEFKDPSGKYNFNFPDNWLISFDQSPYYKDKMDVTVQGPEGKVEILWADSYGGACDNPGYEKITIKSGEETVCHAANIQGEGIPDNTEFWQIQRPFIKGKPEGIYLNGYSYQGNGDLILEIIRSLNITPNGQR